MFKGRFAENIWFVGVKHCLVEIGGDVINVRQTNKLQENIGLVSQWTLKGWGEQKWVTRDGY